MTPISKITLAVACIVAGASASASPISIQNGYVLAGVSDYGTLGSNRAEFAVVRKMKNIDWMDEPHEGSAQTQA